MKKLVFLYCNAHKCSRLSYICAVTPDFRLKRKIGFHFVALFVTNLQLTICLPSRADVRSWAWPICVKAENDFFRGGWIADLREVLQVSQVLRPDPDVCEAGGLRHAAARQEGVLRARLQRYVSISWVFTQCATPQFVIFLGTPNVTRQTINFISYALCEWHCTVLGWLSATTRPSPRPLHYPNNRQC